MKSVIIFMTLFLYISDSFAQVDKGDITIEGIVGYSSKKTESVSFSSLKVTTTGFIVNPRLGYFISGNTEIGLGLNYSQSKEEQIDYSLNGNLYAINPLLRYYSYFNDKLGLFLELNLFYGFGETEAYDLLASLSMNKTVINKFDVTSYGIQLKPGIIFYISNVISINASVGFIEYQKTKFDLSENSSSLPASENELFDIGIDLKSVALGIKINL